MDGPTIDAEYLNLKTEMRQNETQFIVPSEWISHFRSFLWPYLVNAWLKFATNNVHERALLYELLEINEKQTSDAWTYIHFGFDHLKRYEMIA